MSRVGRQPIPLPQGVTAAVEGNLVRVRGARGELAHRLPEGIAVDVADGELLVRRQGDEGRERALHGLTRTLLANMVQGVSAGFTRRLDINGVGYRATKQGNKLVLTIGYSHPVEIEPEKGLSIEVPAPNQIVVQGIDKEAVGRLAARIRAVRQPDPYKNKGIKYTDERLRHKVGKAGTAKKK